MVFQFKVQGLYPVDAQTAGEELTRIYRERGALEASAVVEASRDASAPLHGCFEWDDAAAAEKYREGQAGDLIRAVVTVAEGRQGPETVRAFVHVEQTYHPISVVLESEERTRELLRTAMLELRSFQNKYRSLTELEPVFTAIGEIERGGLARSA